MSLKIVYCIFPIWGFVIACSDNSSSTKSNRPTDQARVPSHEISKKQEIEEVNQFHRQESNDIEFDKFSVYAFSGDIGSSYYLILCDNAVFYNKGSYFHAARLGNNFNHGDNIALYAMPSMSQEPYRGAVIKVLEVDDVKVVFEEVSASENTVVGEYIKVSLEPSILARIHKLARKSYIRLDERQKGAERDGKRDSPY